MTNVREFPKKAKRAKRALVLCPCEDGGTPMNVILMMEESPFISCLICPECGSEVPVIDGYVQADAEAEE